MLLVRTFAPNAINSSSACHHPRQATSVTLNPYLKPICCLFHSSTKQQQHINTQTAWIVFPPQPARPVSASLGPGCPNPIRHSDLLQPRDHLISRLRFTHHSGPCNLLPYHSRLSVPNHLHSSFLPVLPLTNFYGPEVPALLEHISSETSHFPQRS